ncbi:MAG: hypothetical protein ACK4SY_01165 [Pyrobaculum sp.]
MLTELYKGGKIRQETLGVLAKTVICAKLGCLVTGPEVVLENTVLQLAEALTAPPKPPKATRQPPPPPKPPPHSPQEPPKSVEKKVTTLRQETLLEVRRDTQWDFLVSLLVEEVKIDPPKADSLLTAFFNYMSIYPSVGVFRLIEDLSRITKMEPNVVKTAVEILRSTDLIEVREDGVVNIKKVIKKGEIPL